MLCHFVGGPMDGQTCDVTDGALGVTVPEGPPRWGAWQYQRVGNLLLIVADPPPVTPAPKG